jgi:2-polyprenyl-6-methoxyphenol hydroxylase-like FAD-dependent oxidoreductase
MNGVVIAAAGPNGLMLAGELGLAGIRPVVLEPLSGPNPQRRANGITGQAVRLLMKRVLGADVPLRPVSPDAPLDLRRFYGINSRIASRYSSGQVFLVGDAAHVHSPLGGPGLNLGLQDAVNLGWKMAAVIADGADPALLDTYATERRPAAERVVMHSRSQLALVRPGTEVTALRELFAELLEDPGTVRRIRICCPATTIATAWASMRIRWPDAGCPISR